MTWNSPQKPAEYCEQQLLQAILTGDFPIDSPLPAERELAAMLGVTRPTLRETLKRLERDGWVDIRHGKPTRVRDFWREGSLGVLSVIAAHPEMQPAGFIGDLLTVRHLLAPAYTRLAVERAPLTAAAFLETIQSLPDTPQAFAAADWELHHNLTLASGNPVFTLILNGFKELYAAMGLLYFASVGARQHSRRFYADLLACAALPDAPAAAELTAQVMLDSLNMWKSIQRSML